MSRIIFHIGDKKTGPSAIQQALVRGAWRCDAVRLAYPVGADRPHHHWLATGFVRRDRDRIETEFARLAQMIAPINADVVVVSSELFQDARPARLAKAIEQHLPDQAGRAEVIAYARPHAARLVSSYAQVVKLGHFTGDLERFVETSLADGRLQMAERFERWRAVFGARFTLRPMQREHLEGGDVVRDFLHHALSGAAFELDELPGANESLSVGELALLRRFHTLLARQHKALRAEAGGKALDKARNRIGDRLAGHLAARAARGGERLRLHRALAERVAAGCAEDAARCDAAFFAGTPMQDALRDAVGRAPEAAQSLSVKDHFPPELRGQLPVWAGLVGDMMLYDPEGWNGYFLDLLNSSFRGCEGQHGDAAG